MTEIADRIRQMLKERIAELNAKEARGGKSAEQTPSKSEDEAWGEALRESLKERMVAKEGEAR